MAPSQNWTCSQHTGCAHDPRSDLHGVRAGPPLRPHMCGPHHVQSVRDWRPTSLLCYGPFSQASAAETVPADRPGQPRLPGPHDRTCPSQPCSDSPFPQRRGASSPRATLQFPGFMSSVARCPELPVWRQHCPRLDTSLRKSLSEPTGQMKPHAHTIRHLQPCAPHLPSRIGSFPFTGAPRLPSTPHTDHG